MSKVKKEDITQKAFKELFDRINCDAGLVYVDTPEETRLVREIFRKYSTESVQFWSIGQGLHEIEGNKIIASNFYPHKFPATSCRKGKDGSFDTRLSPLHAFSVIEEDCRQKIDPEEEINKKHIYVLRDLDKFLKDPVVIRRLKDLIYLCGVSCSTIILTGNGVTPSSDIEKDAVFIKFKYPTREEIMYMISDLRAKIEDFNKNNENKIDDSFDDVTVAQACIGLTEDQIINTLQYTMNVDNKIDIDKIIEEKKAIINKSEVLEYWTCDNGLEDIGGFGEIKKWFNIKKEVISNIENAEAFEAEPPKGIMILGVQGSGKTAIAKALARSWNVGLIKFEMGKVFNGLVGGSESRTRQALAQIDAAGGIVVIDEIDKSLSGAGSSDRTDGGTTNRVIGTFLTWLNEPHPGVFIVATANDITAMKNNHPELLRKGRFDEIWFSDVPTKEERKEIFAIHLKKRKRDPKNFDLDKLSDFEYQQDKMNYSITGAEIESSIREAIQATFAQGKGKKLKISGKDDISTEDILEQLKVTKPITKIAKSTISNMRNWSKDNARNVSLVVKKEAKKSKSGNLKLRATDNIEL